MEPLYTEPKGGTVELSPQATWEHLSIGHTDHVENGTTRDMKSGSCLRLWLLSHE